MRVRQSTLASFERCERRGWYAMHEAPNKPREGVSKGSAVHALIDARAQGRPDPREVPHDIARVADALAAMVPHGAEQIGSEVSFATEGPGFDMEGTLDALYRRDDGYLIGDRKTVAVLPSKAKRDIRAIGPQPYFYAWGVMSEFAITHVDLAYWYASRPKKGDQLREPIKTCSVTGALGVEEVRTYLERRCAPIVVRMNRVRSLPVFAARPNTDACFDYGGCAYRMVCSYGPKKDLDAAGK